MKQSVIFSLLAGAAAARPNFFAAQQLAAGELEDELETALLSMQDLSLFQGVHGLWPKPEDFPDLLPWFSINLRFLRMAYTATFALRSDAPFDSSTLAFLRKVMHRCFAVHMTLGPVSYYRLLGSVDDLRLNKIAWARYDLVNVALHNMQTDSFVSPPGLDAYCGAISIEHDQLIARAAALGVTPSPLTPNASFVALCAEGGFVSQLVVLDWEQHRQGYLGAYFQADPTIRDALITHHFLHWDSLLVAQGDADRGTLLLEVVRLFRDSFLPLQRISPMWNDLVVRAACDEAPGTCDSDSDKEDPRPPQIPCPVGCVVGSQPLMGEERALLFAAAPPICPKGCVA